MARGTSTSGRAPAHLSVVPGGAGGLDDLEEDRTTIEPAPQLPMNAGHADEAPTPIAPAGSLAEQWEDGTTVAEPSGTSTRSAIVEESTIEETARPLPPLQLVPSGPAPDPASRAKLIVLAGADQDREFAIGPGVEVRIGRAVDNDVVLTDIAVSRKHLVLSWEADAWVIQDNGSGNGTLVNDRLEDGRCQLHHGDRIEIGNTIFRFDHLPSAQQGAVASWGQRDEEAATVAGKAPLRPSEVAAAAAAPEPRRHRPASVTAPVHDRALRKRPGATEPPPPPPRSRAKTAPPPVPRVTTAAPASPPPPMATPAPILFAPPSAPVGRPAAAPQLLTSPGPVPVAPSGPVPMPMSGPYTAPGPTFGPGASGAYAAPYGGALRPMTTTAQVEPRAYAAVNPYMMSRGHPVRSRKGMWIAMGVVALASIAAAGAMLGGDEVPPKAAPAIEGAAPTTEATPAAGTPAVAPGTQPDVAAGTVVEPAPTVAGPAVPAPATPEPTAPEPTAPEPTAPEPTAPEPTVAEPGVAVAVAPPPAPERTPAPPVAERAPTPKPKPTERVAKITSPGRAVVAEPKPPPPTKGLAAAAKKAEGLYKGKDFKGAAAALREAIGTSTDAEAKTLKSRANAYDAVGNSLTAAAGMGTQRATEALTAYKRAMASDRQAGGAHQLYIRDKIASVAPRAAALYMARQSYELAKVAADDAVNVGVGGTSMVSGVRSSLERRAGEFYGTATKLQKSKPTEAKALARRITKMVPGDSPWYGKAVALLKGASSNRDEDE